MTNTENNKAEKGQQIIIRNEIIAQSTLFSRDFELTQEQDRETLLTKTTAFLDEELTETKDAIAQGDRAEIVDGFGDIAFIALNGIYKEFRSVGDSHEQAVEKTEKVMTRICEANNGKRQADGTVKYIEGKVQKPEGWTKPQYEDLLNKAA